MLSDVHGIVRRPLPRLRRANGESSVTMREGRETVTRRAVRDPVAAAAGLLVRARAAALATMEAEQGSTWIDGLCAFGACLSLLSRVASEAGLHLRPAPVKLADARSCGELLEQAQRLLGAIPDKGGRPSLLLTRAYLTAAIREVTEREPWA